MKYVVLLLSFFCLWPCQGQDYAHWDKKYLLKSYRKLIAEENAYLVQVKKTEKPPHDYFRFDTYRMRGKFMGKERPIDPAIMQSMKVVCWAFPGSLLKPAQLDGLIKKEFLFNVEGVEVWMPIEKMLETHMHQEVKVGEDVTLYCLFLNDHRLNHKLYNTLMISEFKR